MSNKVSGVFDFRYISNGEVEINEIQGYFGLLGGDFWCDSRSVVRYRKDYRGWDRGGVTDNFIILKAFTGFEEQLLRRHPSLNNSGNATDKNFILQNKS